MRRNGLFSLVASVVIAVAGLVYTFVAGNSPLLGLDLQGGVSVVLQPTEEVEGEALDQSISIIRQRVDGIGVAEPDIIRQGETIVVQLPGIDDREEAIELVGTTAELRFRPVRPDLLGGLGGLPGLDQLPGDLGDPIVPPEGGEAPAEEPAAEDEQGSGPLVPGESALGVQAPETTVPPEDTTPPRDPGEPPPATVPPAEGEPPPVPAPIPPPADLPGAEACVPGEPYDATAFEEAGADEPVVRPQVEDGEIVACLPLGPTVFTGEVLSSAEATIPQGQWMVAVEIRGESRDEVNLGFDACALGAPECPASPISESGRGQMAIVLDEVVTSAPSVNQTGLANDGFVIEGDFTEDDAKDLALVLRYGSLPIELEQQAVQEVSATLGQDALDAGLIAGAVGVALVALFMIGYYRMLGVVAMLSLTVSGALLWTVIAFLGETQGLALTLAGVTGIIVSVGVAVDSNVVFYEHLKEDTAGGRSLRASVDGSFRNSFSTILKADIASLIGAGVLYFLTVGPVRGFALFLGISTLLDLIASWVFMRPMVLILAKRPAFQDRPRLFGVARPKPVEAAT